MDWHWRAFLFDVKIYYQAVGGRLEGIKEMIQGALWEGGTFTIFDFQDVLVRHWLRDVGGCYIHRITMSPAIVTSL